MFQTGQPFFRVTSRQILRITGVNHRKEGFKPMNNQDSGTIIITFLLLLPWLGRAAVSAVAIWRERIETQGRKAKQSFQSGLSRNFALAISLIPALRFMKWVWKPVL